MNMHINKHEIEKRMERRFRERHKHGDIKLFVKGDITYLSCSLCCGSIRLLDKKE